MTYQEQLVLKEALDRYIAQESERVEKTTTLGEIREHTQKVSTAMRILSRIEKNIASRGKHMTQWVE